MTGRITIHDFPSDPGVSDFLCDTVRDALFSPATVYAYKMRPQKTEKDTLVTGHAIDYTIGELDVSCYSILQFYLKDITNYVCTDEKVKTLFTQNIGFVFEGVNNEKVYLLLAFNGNQLEIVYRDSPILRCQFTNERYLLRFAYALLPENEYIENLLNTYKY